ncbi:hypothetical protein GOP47_0022819 [Adiantum capillus-veneris]|uniref:Subtilisin inhibitor 1 n=1 Tax=Adiantum capillus-veneris TaxID=13818 RepID=A0A9D4U701_ADICA|nr:hypothetical protein GOP47_0022819 [Adiantum capillus-veneris]
MAAEGDGKQAMELNPPQQYPSTNPANIFQVNTGPQKIWPELVGLSGEEAKSKILAENPNLTVQLVPEGSFMTMDFRTDRVRIFVDAAGNVSRAPAIG